MRSKLVAKNPTVNAFLYGLKARKGNDLLPENYHSIYMGQSHRNKNVERDTTEIEIGKLLLLLSCRDSINSSCVERDFFGKRRKCAEVGRGTQLNSPQQICLI